MEFPGQELDLSMPEGREVKGSPRLEGHLWVQTGTKGERIPAMENTFLNLRGADWVLSGIRLPVHPFVNISFYHNSSKTTGWIFLNLVRMFLSISSCASTENKIRFVDKHGRRWPSYDKHSFVMNLSYVTRTY